LAVRPGSIDSRTDAFPHDIVFLFLRHDVPEFVGCVEMKLAYYNVILSNAKDLITSLYVYRFFASL